MGVKLGQKWAVKDGNLLASNQVGSRFFNKEFDFSRASNGTYVDRDGLLKTAELYNLLSYSEDFSGYTNANSTDEANATISPSGVQNATSFLEAATTGQHKLTTSISFDGSSTYTFSIYAKTNGRDLYIDTQNSNEWGGRAWFDLTEGTANSVLGSASIQDVGNGWYRCIVTGASILSGGNLIELLTSNGSSNSTTGDTTKGVYIYGAQLVEGTEPLDYQYTNGLQGLPRISFEDGVGHLLLEPQRTNGYLYSQSAVALNYSNGVTFTNNYAISPDGQQNAINVVPNETYTQHRAATNSGAIQYNTNDILTYSIFIKPNGYNYVYVGGVFGGESAIFNLIDGVVISQEANVIEAKIEEYANGWYRCSTTYTFQNAIANNYIYAGVRILDDEQNIIFSGDNVKGIFVYGMQVELGSYSTSYIKTEGTSVTRLADVCNNSGSAQDFNSEEGVIYGEGNFLTSSLASGYSYFVSLSDGTINNRLEIRQSTPNLQFLWRVGGVYQNNILTSGLDVAQNFKFALLYSSAKIAFWVNGSEIGVINSPLLFSSNTLNTLEFADGSGGYPFYGKVRNVQVFTEALSDAELISLTT